MSDENQTANARKDANATDESLKELLHFFGAVSLGDGNVNAGANTLAAMALCLANLVRPEVRVIGSNGQGISIGCSFVASGQLTPSLVSDYVVKVVAASQTGLNRAMAEHERVIGIRAKYMAEGYNPNSIMDPNREMQRATEQTTVEKILNMAGDLFNGPPDMRALVGYSNSNGEGNGRHELLSRHTYFISGESPAVTLKLLGNVHAGRPLVSFALKNARDVAAYDELVGNILDGYCHWNSTAQGHVIVLDPTGVGSGMRAGVQNPSSWMNRVLWLVDGEDLPGFNAYCDPKSSCKVTGGHAFKEIGLIDTLSSRFEDRYDHKIFPRGGSVTNIHTTIGVMQTKWCRFLLASEAFLPGVTCVLRSLPASLIAGFQAMGFKSELGHAAGVHAAYKMAVVLLNRMRRSLEQLSKVEIKNRHETLEKRVIGSLAKNGPLKSYSIAKNLNGVRTEECNAALQTLESRGLVQRKDGQFWYLADSGVVARN